MVEHLHLPGSDAVRLHVARRGDHGPLLIFLHGFPECWMAWHRQLDSFGGDCRAVAPDLRGYNLSDKPEGTQSYGLSRVAADIAALIRALSPDAPALVVGHDWGGLTAWYLAQHYRPLVSRLVVINAPHPALFGRELRTNPLQVLASTYVAAFQVRRLAEYALRARSFALLRAMVWGLSTRAEAFSDGLQQAYREAWAQPGALPAGLAYYRNAENIRLLLSAPAGWHTDVPTLVLWGDLDPALRPGNLRRLHTIVRTLTIRRHAACTHWIVHEEPDWVDARIRDHMTKM